MRVVLYQCGLSWVGIIKKIEEVMGGGKPVIMISDSVPASRLPPSTPARLP